MNLKNFAIVEVSTGYNSSATSIVLATGQGSRFPDPTTESYNAVWFNSTDYASPDLDPNAEIVTVTAKTGDTLTIVRPVLANKYNREGDENTAKDHNIAGKQYKMLLAVTKSVVDEIDLRAQQFVGICATTPITEADIVIDYNARTLTIVPPLGYFHFYVDGDGETEKFTKVGNVTFPAWTDTSGVWYLHFDKDGNAVTTQTAWTSFDIIATVYRFAWNATLSGAAKSAVEALETHLNNISSADHAWKHRYGAVWNSGLTLVHNRLASGTPNADGRNTCVSLTSGQIIDDNLFYTITNGVGATKFTQDMGNISAGSLTISNGGIFRVRTQDAGGLLDALTGTRFPFAWNSGSNRPEYITSNGTRTLVANGDFFVYYLYGIQDPRTGETIKSVSAPTSFTSLTNAQASSWTDIQATYPLISDPEIRPLYKLIYQYGSGYSAAIKYSALRDFVDYRKTPVSTTASLAGSIAGTSVTMIAPTGFVGTNAQALSTEIASNLSRKSATYTDNDTSQDFTDADVTANSVVEVYAQATPVGGWTVSSYAGGFTITSTKAESTDIPFVYYIKNN
jgi:hypothetical protein